MKLQIFDGGLSTRKSPQQIGQTEAVEYTNIDNEKGILTPVKSKVASAIATARFATYYKAADRFISSSTYQDTVEFQKKLYVTSESDRPKKYDGTSVNNLGIDAPVSKPVTSTTTKIASPTDVDIVTGVAGDLPSVIHRYIIVANDGTYNSAVLEISVNLVDNRIQRLNDILEELGERERREINTHFLNNSAITTRNVTLSNVKNIDYSTGSTVEVYRFYAGQYYKVGTLTSAVATLNDSVYDISANDVYEDSSFAPIDGTMFYKYTFVNSLDGTESAPSPVSDELVTLSTVTISNMQVSSDPQVDKKRIYRSGGNIANFSLVAEVNNADDTYLDELKDSEIIGTILASENNLPPPRDLQHITEAYAMLFGAEGTKLRFSAIGEPDSWSAFFFLNFSAVITGIAPTINGLLVLTEDTTYIVTGSSPGNFAQRVLDANQGCVSSSSIQFIKDSAVWVSKDGICASDGTKVEVVTKEKQGKINLDPVDSVIHDQVYYLLESTGIITALDFRYNSIIKNLDLDINALVTAKDVLYGHKDGLQYSLFASTTVEAFNYTSPRFVEGRMTEEKAYKKVYIFSEGDIIVKIYINNVLVLSKSLSGNDSHELKVPQDKQRGNYIHFNISGTGTVHELEYVASRRQND